MSIEGEVNENCLNSGVHFPSIFEAKHILLLLWTYKQVYTKVNDKDVFVECEHIPSIHAAERRLKRSKIIDTFYGQRLNVDFTRTPIIDFVTHNDNSNIFFENVITWLQKCMSHVVIDKNQINEPEAIEITYKIMSLYIRPCKNITLSSDLTLSVKEVVEKILENHSINQADHLSLEKSCPLLRK